MPVNAQYNLAAPGSLPVRIAAHQRRKMFAAFQARTRISQGDTVLDIGATSDRSYEHSNYFEAWYPHKDRITAVGIDDASFLEDEYPGLRFVLADGRDLPFPDGSFDYVHSSAVLEHVGSRENQMAFLRQMWRVARKGVFATTPNRWFPVEFHTILPLLHWLPPAAHRGVLSAIGKPFFAREENLNLLSKSDLRSLARRASMDSVEIGSVTLGAWPTNLLLYAPRQGRTADGSIPI